MSAFTQFNGPQSSSGPSTKDITAFIEAYNNLSTKLAAHIEAVAPTDTTVHGIANYVSGIKAQLETLIGTKAEVTALNAVRDTANAAATQAALNEAVANITSLITDTDSINTALTEKADKATTTAIQDDINSLTKSLKNLKEAWTEHSAHITDTTTKLAFDCAIESATYIIGKIKVFKIIDFTKWSHFSAPFAGTGGISDTSTNGAFILGCLSLDWEDDPNAPAEGYAHKAARAYIKYVNSNPFDAICDMVVSKTDDGYIGSLTVHLAKKAGTWADLAFHLLLGTNSKHTECVYLAVSASGLSSASGDYPNTNFRACGENFLPVGEDGYVTPSGMLEGITSVTIGTNASSITGIDNLRLNQLWSPNYFDGDGYSLIRVVSKIDPDDETTYRQVFIGDANHDELTFIKRPSMIIENDAGEQKQAYFVTAQDIINVTMPVGAVIRWPFVNEDGSLRNIPTGFLACNGAQVSNADYPELCELLGYNASGISTLPIEDHAIIKAVFFDIIDKTAQPNYDELVEFSMLNKKLNKEITRATSAESGLSVRITTNADTIKAEVTRATAAEQTNTDTIKAEVTRATAAEQTLMAGLTTGLASANSNIAANADAIEAEVTRATAAETVNANAIEAEVTRATAAETVNANAIEAEVTRATAAETTNANAIANETSRAIAAETTLNTRVDHYEVMEDRLQANIDAEATRAKTAETQLQTNVEAETTRATTAEQTNADAIEAEVTRATTAEQTNADAIEAEVTRATTAEQTNTDAIEAEVTRATTAEQANATTIANETTRAKAAETAEAEARSTQDATITRSVAEETQRATTAEHNLSDRIDQLHSND